MQGQETWNYPPASKELNTEIALAIDACIEGKLKEYTLLLSEGDFLVIDYYIRRDMKTPEGAKGEDILKKVFRARAELAFVGLLSAESDETYLQAKSRSKHANDSANNNAGENTSPEPGTEPVSGA